MKSISKARARKLAKSLSDQNRSGVVWRDLKKKYGVAGGTLNRIAKSKGSWLPKDEEILKKLGLVTVRSPYAIMPRWWERSPEALRVFKYTRDQARIIANETREAQYAYKKVKP